MRLQDLVTRIGIGGGADRRARADGSSRAASPSLDDVDRLVAEGRHVEALDQLVELNRREPRGDLEVRLVDLRHEAAADLQSTGRTPWPPVYADPFPDLVGRPPEIPAAELSVEVLGGAVAHHGALLVRGLFTDEQVARGIEIIHRVEVLRDAEGAESSTDRWYRPFPGLDPFHCNLRRMVAGQGGTWLADSPAATAQVLDDLAASGAMGAITEHFGERPLFSVQKSTLRHSPPVHNFAGWHQDGSFLGSKARTMNVWVALSHCGGDEPTPGLEVVPRRMQEILPRDGGLGSASIADATVLQAAGDTPPVRPEFAPGDGLLFDERLVHRTHLTPGMTRPRCAIECWLFAPAHEAEKYVSLLT